MNPLVAVVIGVAVLALILVMISRTRRSNDGVDSFRRQIDALSPEARRPVIDQMYGSSGRHDLRAEPRADEPVTSGADEAEGDATGGDAGDEGDEGDQGDDEGDARGA